MEANTDTWLLEFERIGEGIVRNSLAQGRATDVGIKTEPKRDAAFQWLRDKERDRERRQIQTHWYAKWAFRAAVGAFVMSFLAILVTLWIAFRH
ncbi:MAG: hypothetical protein JO134_12015 [Xanthobacteraceae bacterium]|nr:hypothetical protein [Xanthobacteraceae bacterium]